ncbi:MAG: class F sortase, partial [Streptosporangiaceae bacterium]
MAPAHLERHHDAHLPPVGLELHHEPAYLDLTEARTRTRVRVLGLALRIPVPRPRAQLVLALVVLVVGLGITAAATAGLLADGHGRYVLAAAARSVAAPKGRWTFAPQTVPHATAARVPPPVYLTIPAIGVRTRLIRLGLTHSGGLQAPGTTAVAGWYTGSPPPGAVGAAVIGGHVDSYVGPGVFFTLRLLHPGDRIYVRQAGGRLAV